MKSKLKKAGYIIITDSTYLSNEEYCVRGAIYVKASSHTVCGLTNGSKADKTLEKVGISANSEIISSDKKTDTKVDVAYSKDNRLKGMYKTTASLNLRAGAGTNKKILAVMPKGAKVQCYGYYTSISGTKWLYVIYNGITGFASIRYLKK